MKIRNITLIALFLLGSVLATQAKVIDQATACKAATNFFYDRLSQKQVADYSLIRVNSVKTISDNTQTPLYHVIAFTGGGFVIITADDALHPIIGYSITGTYSDDPANCCFNSWMTDMQDQIQYYRNQNVKTESRINALWTRLLDDDFASKPIEKASKNVDPLMSSIWGQSKYYNSYCPKESSSPDGHVPVGCVGLSMAQSMFYYRYPTTGQGSWTYTANNPDYGNYGVQTANFGNTTYKWDEMVLEATEANLALATLCYHCGVAVSMKYGPDASGSQTSYIPSAMASYFKYSNNIQFVQRMSYGLQQWRNILINNIDNKNPLIYSGRNTLGGHAWNCDGYQSYGTDYMFHFNWGWDGMSDGYYNIDTLTPGGEPHYSQDQSAVRNIYPNANYPVYCSGQKVLTSAKGTIEDGSGPSMNYQNNSNCSWLISPTDTVKKILLTFKNISTETGNDVITVYNGATTSAPVLFTFSGNLAADTAIMSTSNRMLVTFISNATVVNSGFFATYQSVYGKYCQGTNYTAPSGTISDGSGPKNYLNNTVCAYTIVPPASGKVLVLAFNYFNLDSSSTRDYVRVYDLANQNTPLGTFTGKTLPPMIVSPSGTMYIEFKTDFEFTFAGWEATYAPGNLSIDETSGISNLAIYPNPVTSQIHIDLTTETKKTIDIQLLNLTGQFIKQIQYKDITGEMKETMDVSQLPKGVYVLKLLHDQGNYSHRIVVQ